MGGFPAHGKIMKDNGIGQASQESQSMSRPCHPAPQLPMATAPSPIVFRSLAPLHLQILFLFLRLQNISKIMEDNVKTVLR